MAELLGTNSNISRFDGIIDFSTNTEETIPINLAPGEDTLPFSLVLEPGERVKINYVGISTDDVRQGEVVENNTSSRLFKQLSLTFLNLTSNLDPDSMFLEIEVLESQPTTTSAGSGQASSVSSQIGQLTPSSNNPLSGLFSSFQNFLGGGRG